MSTTKLPPITLCADTESVRHPEIIGLDGERLDAQEWLMLCTDGASARKQAYSTRPQEVWVAGSDDVDSINLAAALKADGAVSKVCLLAFEKTGSLYSRAQAAKIDEILDKPAFASRYLACKRFAQADTAGVEIQEQPVYAQPQPAQAQPTQMQPAQAQPTQMQPAQAQPISATPAPVQSKPEIQAGTTTRTRGFVLAVIGAGGGVGKSSISVLSACCAQRLGLSTVIVDADLQFGDVHFLMGVEHPLTLDAALAAPARLDALHPEEDRPAVLAAPANLEQSEVVFEQLDTFVERLRQRFDVVVVNTASWYNDAQMRIIEQASNVLFVVGQRPSSVRACRHALRLCARCGVAAQPFIFVLNRCSRHALFSSIDVSCALQGVHVDELQDGGREVEELLGAGQPLDLLNSKNAFATSMIQLANDIFPKKHTAQAAAIQMPPSRRKGRFAMRRKKAACL